MMRKRSKIAMAAVIALGLAGAVAFPLIGQAQGWRGSAVGGGAQHIEGRVAFLKAELKITSSQEAAWRAVEKVMRENAAELGKLREELIASKDKSQSAAERLDRRARFAETRAKEIAAFASAFKPLYDQLSDDQRKAADALFQPHFRRG